MADEKFRIEADVSRGMLRLWLIGFWSAGDVSAFAAAEQAEAAKLSRGQGQHLVLADLSQFKLQSQEVVALCERFIRHAANQSRRLALVGGKELSWIQIKRMMVRDHIAAFENARSAEQWLLTGDDHLVRCDREMFAQKAAKAAALIVPPSKFAG